MLSLCPRQEPGNSLLGGGPFQTEGSYLKYVCDFDAIGVVQGDSGSPISLQNWVQFIATHPQLRAPESVRSVNPFNKRDIEIAPDSGTAYVWENGSVIGMMTWSEEGLDEIVVYGASPLVLDLANKVALQLGGHVDRLR